MSPLEMKWESSCLNEVMEQITQEEMMVHVRCWGGDLQEMLEDCEEAIQTGRQPNCVLLASLDSVSSI